MKLPLVLSVTEPLVGLVTLMAVMGLPLGSESLLKTPGAATVSGWF